ncbi:MAG TPA: hypothetical protein DEB10_13170 [Ruminococcaceae bacterium]|jgi:hypothetical protein|nr:hypothetical protein [Oscillospiraceae bacterium]
MGKLLDINLARTICFYGHRPDHLLGYGDINHLEIKKCINALQELLENEIEQGKYFFAWRDGRLVYF